MVNNTYIGITLGPIYKTLGLVTKSRELWAASYLFSYICKKLIEAFNSNGCKAENYIMPYWDKKEKSKPGAGFLPDRIIIHSSLGFDYDNVINIVQKVRKDVSEEIIFSLKNSKYKYLHNHKGYKRIGISEILKDEKKAIEFLNSYFQIYSCEIDLDKIKINGFNRLKTINTVLDQLELRYSIVDTDPNPLRIFLHAVNHTFLLTDCFHPLITHFDSLPEIALRELRVKYRKAYDAASELVYDSIKSAPEDLTKNVENEVFEEDEKEPFKDLISIALKDDSFRTYHNYVAIVTADGDNFGKLLKAIEGDTKDNSQFQNKLEAFSKQINNFSLETYKLIAGSRYTEDSKEDWGYGAAPVYLGGDDLLFFAPVMNKVGDCAISIFDIVKQIDSIFQTYFEKDEYKNLKDEDGNEIKPCMSYGVYISYIKHPLREAVLRSRELLEVIKEKKYETRNRLNFEVRKHSGSTFGAIIDKNKTDLFNNFLSIINNQEFLDKEQFLSSITQKMRDQKSTVNSITEEDWHLKAYFDDEFNKGIHKKQRAYLDECREYLFKVGQLKNISENPENELLLENFFSVLKLNHFLHSRIDD